MIGCICVLWAVARLTKLHRLIMRGAKLVIFGHSGKIFMSKNARKALISCIFRINFARIPPPEGHFSDIGSRCFCPRKSLLLALKVIIQNPEGHYQKSRRSSFKIPKVIIQNPEPHYPKSRTQLVMALGASCRWRSGLTFCHILQSVGNKSAALSGCVLRKVMLLTRIN